MAKRKLTAEEWASMEFMLTDCTCSWPNLYETEIYRGNGKEEPTDRYTVQAIFDKDTPLGKKNYAAWEEAVNNAIALNPNFEGTIEDLSKKMLNDYRNALKDGDEEKNDRNKGKWILKLSSSKTRPTTLGRDRNPVVPADAGDPTDETIARQGIFYAGCKIDVIGSIWLMDGTNGQWIGCNLKAIRFRGDGEPIGGGSAMPVDAAKSRFDELDDEVADGADEI